jgi:riboflavin synthase
MTVIATHSEWFVFEAGPESLARTTLGELAPGDRVNLERSLSVGDRLGGHFVTGHVDCVGRILDRIPSGEWETVWFGFPKEHAELIVDVEADRFSVMLIPHTRTHTTLGIKVVGDGVNLECDLLAKHVRKLIRGPR